jgi:hypothetical protein
MQIVIIESKYLQILTFLLHHSGSYRPLAVRCCSSRLHIPDLRERRLTHCFAERLLLRRRVGCLEIYRDLFVKTR